MTLSRFWARLCISPTHSQAIACFFAYQHFVCLIIVFFCVFLCCLVVHDDISLSSDDSCEAFVLPDEMSANLLSSTQMQKSEDNQGNFLGTGMLSCSSNQPTQLLSGDSDLEEGSAEGEGAKDVEERGGSLSVEEDTLTLQYEFTQDVNYMPSLSTEQGPTQPIDKQKEVENGLSLQLSETLEEAEAEHVDNSVATVTTTTKAAISCGNSVLTTARAIISVSVQNSSPASQDKISKRDKRLESTTDLSCLSQEFIPHSRNPVSSTCSYKENNNETPASGVGAPPSCHESSLPSTAIISNTSKLIATQSATEEVLSEALTMVLSEAAMDIPDTQMANEVLSEDLEDEEQQSTMDKSLATGAVKPLALNSGKSQENDTTNICNGAESFGRKNVSDELVAGEEKDEEVDEVCTQDQVERWRQRTCNRLFVPSRYSAGAGRNNTPGTKKRRRARSSVGRLENRAKMEAICTNGPDPVDGVFEFTESQPLSALGYHSDSECQNNTKRMRNISVSPTSDEQFDKSQIGMEENEIDPSMDTKVVMEATTSIQKAQRNPLSGTNHLGIWVGKPLRKRGRAGRIFYGAVRVPWIDGTIRVGDCVLLRSGKAMSYVAEVTRMFQENSGGEICQYFTAKWFFRPEELHCGRRDSHGEKELFKSDFGNDNVLETLEDKCHVHVVTSPLKAARAHLEDVEQLVGIENRRNEKENQRYQAFFCRYKYLGPEKGTVQALWEGGGEARPVEEDLHLSLLSILSLADPTHQAHQEMQNQETQRLMTDLASESCPIVNSHERVCPVQNGCSREISKTSPPKPISSALRSKRRCSRDPTGSTGGQQHFFPEKNDLYQSTMLAGQRSGNVKVSPTKSEAARGNLSRTSSPSHTKSRQKDVPLASGLRTHNISPQKVSKQLTRATFPSPRSKSGHELRSDLFRNIEFLVTGFSGKQGGASTRKLQNIITKFGGKVLPNIPDLRCASASEHFDGGQNPSSALSLRPLDSPGNRTTSPRTRKNVSERLIDALSKPCPVSDGSALFPHFDSILTVVVAPYPVRTVKYLFGLARGLSALDGKWVEDCASAGGLLHPCDYTLPSGVSIQTGDEMQIPRRSLRARLGVHPLPLCERVLAGVSVNLQGSPKFVAEWSILVQEAGCSLVNIPAVGSTLRSRSGRACKHPTHSKEAPNLQCDAVVVEVGFRVQEAHFAAYRNVIPFVTPSWVVQCLICQKRVPFQSSSSFSYEHLEPSDSPC